MVDDKEKNMKCLTFFLMLPETVKNRSKKSSKKTTPSSSSSSSSNSSSKLPPVCYEIITLKTKKKKKMAADIFPRKKPANSSSTTVQQYHQQNLSNNNLIPAPNWQGLYPTIRERNAVMFNNDLMADVHFVVGPPGGTQRLPGHKYVLAVGSSVFHAMFYGELAEDKDEIRIPDVDPAAFLAMLKYIYCDEIDLAADTVLATLYAAKKYIVPHLARACVNFLETSLSAKNACVLLSQSCLFEEPDLTQRCWEVIDAQAELALKSEGFCDIDFQTLESILRRETLNAKEIVVFEAALNWAEVECQRQDLALSIENKRKVLGKALYLIRIPTMALDDFANGAAQSGVLTLNETNDIFLWYTAAKKPELQFVSKARKGLVPQRCHRFQSCAYRSNQWRYRGRCDSIQFAVDKRVFIAGFGLYGSSCGSAEYSAKIELKRQGVVLGQNLSKYFSDGSSNTFPVWFEYPVQIEPDTFYTASVILDGNELSYFGQEGMTEVQCGKVTVQFQCSSDSTNGTGVQGGQIPELIFYA
ncbi:BTB/POZ domain-containing protein 3 isoform X1 [Phacochoerus africanus]|uniref:BTB domain containing 3 n=2 Tax=Sus scrofa TaxID=9823 RepID=A0A8D0P058_PIG|nr:BTB/POZ domain-containing protein 3 isoform X1 [Sus scrofa]XP_047627630.1 BTB/POZ domain-containing protein 3 isoform X1 [Phacochoerus africanus]